MSEVIVEDRGSKAWVGLEDKLRAVSTDTGPEMSLESMLSLEGGRLILRRSILMNPSSLLAFLRRAMRLLPLLRYSTTNTMSRTGMMPRNITKRTVESVLSESGLLAGPLSSLPPAPGLSQ